MHEFLASCYSFFSGPFARALQMSMLVMTHIACPQDPDPSNRLDRSYKKAGESTVDLQSRTTGLESPAQHQIVLIQPYVEPSVLRAHTQWLLRSMLFWPGLLGAVPSRQCAARLRHVRRFSGGSGFAGGTAVCYSQHVVPGQTVIALISHKGRGRCAAHCHAQ